MSAQESTVLAALCRSDFSLFVLKVFEELHPGAPPLRRAWYGSGERRGWQIGGGGRSGACGSSVGRDADFAE